MNLFSDLPSITALGATLVSLALPVAWAIFMLSIHAPNFLAGVIVGALGVLAVAAHQARALTAEVEENEPVEIWIS